MAPKTQKVLLLNEEKAPWKVVSDWPVPPPGPKDVLVKVVAAAINPSDWKVQAFGMPIIKYPFIGGIDGAGYVEEVGAEVTAFKKGDRVYARLFASNRIAYTG